ncbi:MAG: hypothetical protein ACOYJJ_02925 [Anaerovoracaceae bacterium]|jgi:hypothetical protein
MNEQNHYTEAASEKEALTAYIESIRDRLQEAGAKEQFEGVYTYDDGFGGTTTLEIEMRRAD